MALYGMPVNINSDMHLATPDEPDEDWDEDEEREAEMREAERSWEDRTER